MSEYHHVLIRLGFGALDHFDGSPIRVVTNILGLFVMFVTFLFLAMSIWRLTRRRYGARP